MKGAKKPSRPRTGYLDEKKIAIYAVVINSLEIIAALGLTAVLFSGQGWNSVLGKTAVAFLAAIVVLGAVMDIRSAMRTLRMRVDNNSLGETVEAMTEQNRALRVQRHDFLNHLQVVYSLMEMREYDEAMKYISQVYGDIRRVSSGLKTASAPVNALLMAKAGECREKGIAFETAVNARWEHLPIPDWEMCRCLSNLIDNAADALKDTRHPKIRVQLSETLERYSFCVRNNGPRIEKENLDSIFEAGFSLKGEGRGMGLYITRKTLRDGGGDITVESNDRWTSFSGYVPRPSAAAVNAAGTGEQPGTGEDRD